MKQHEIKKAHPLLDDNGYLIEAGYAKHLILDYDRKQIKASKLRIKEWDYYLIGNKDFALSLTLADNSYMGLAGAQFFDFNEKHKINFSKFIPFTMGKMKMPNTSLIGDVSYLNKKIKFSFKSDVNTKKLFCQIAKFDGNKKLLVDITLTDIPKESMVIATPFKKYKKAFYYNQKINHVPEKGFMEIGDKRYDLNQELAVLDWGRGVWTYDNTWYWSSLSTKLPDGNLFGFNLGYGFGDTSNATENMAFYNGIAHKLEQVDFGIPMKNGKPDYMNTWHFTSSDNRLKMTFRPLYDNRTDLNFLIISQDAHQVFVLFTGYVILDNGKKIEIEDSFGFAEKVRNRW